MEVWMTEGPCVNVVMLEALFEIYTWILCLSYLHEKQTSRIQSLYLYFIKIVPFWLWNIRFEIHNRAVFRTAAGAAGSYVSLVACWKNGCQNFSNVYRSRKHWKCKYTNGKKKQCIAKMLITHKICSGWAWKFINMVSPIRTFNYPTFTRFHVLLVRHLFFLWKLHFMSSATEKQHATKLIDAKRKFMERMIRKPLYFC